MQSPIRKGDKLEHGGEVTGGSPWFEVMGRPLARKGDEATRYEKPYWPQVRVLAAPETADLYVAHVREALRLAALPPLEVQAVPATEGLLVADGWLDARDHRPLLAVAAAWYDDAIDEGCAEGCAAVLLDPGYFRLPPEVRHKAALHRPVQGLDGEAEYGFANAAIWGKARAAAVTRAWITRPVEHSDRALAAAGFQVASKDAAQHRLDRIVGNVGAANGLLAIAAAMEAGAKDGPQLVVDGLQSAILHVIPAVQTNASTHDDSQK
ncbi:PAAR domain-containing protein [Paraburkholderia acidipaludis]|uniref:PAAR domain-containing protein n=1 Tax=Paraburkholderia acidipaludis TaxID=660537 RepID=UPI000A06D645